MGANAMQGKLTALGVARLKTPGLYGDGGGLWLQVSGKGGKSWVFRYTLKGKSREMGLGSVNTFSLAEARDKALTCRKLCYEGIDPIEMRRGQRQDAAVEAAKAITFRTCAEKYIEAHKAGWRNDKHAAQWTATLDTYAHPVFGDLPVQAVDTGLVMRALEPIWSAKPETATRVRGRIESVLDWAATRGYLLQPGSDCAMRWPRLRRTDDELRALAVEMTWLVQVACAGEPESEHDAITEAALLVVYQASGCGRLSGSGWRSTWRTMPA